MGIKTQKVKVPFSINFIIAFLAASVSAYAVAKLNPDYIAKIFKTGFQLVNSKFSRRRLIASHWYWLVREK